MVIVFSYPDIALSQNKWAEAKAIFGDRRKFADFAVSGPIIAARDEKGRSFFARLEGNSIVFVIGRISLTDAASYLDRVAVKLSSLPQAR